MKTFKHPMGYTCHIIKARYGNDRMALQLVDAESGEPVCTITTNLDAARLGIDCVHIKDWSENEGLDTALEAAGLGKKTGRIVHSGFVQVPEFRLNIPELNLYLPKEQQISSDEDNAPPAPEGVTSTKRIVLIVYSHVEELIQNYYDEKDRLYDAKETLSDLMQDRDTHPDVDQSEIAEATRDVNEAREHINAALEKLHNYLAKQFA